jgi:uncharacterized protein (TIGR02757 family)
MNKKELREFLDFKAALYNEPQFIDSDPIQIPHLFTKKEAIEIAGFLTATIAWGNRKSILKNARKLMELMEMNPHDFILNFEESDLERFQGFVHRTFNELDLVYFLKSLQHIYKYENGLEKIFTEHSTESSTQESIHHFKNKFFQLEHLQRTTKHVSDPAKNSAAKRINMYLRWMVRQDNNGVDFGIWKKIAPAALSCPLDIHSGNIARKLGLLKRKQNDGKALKELDAKLREFDSQDPVKYDFALFGIGAFEKTF